MEARLTRLLESRGPLTGAEISEALGDASFALYKASMLSPRLAVRRVGRRYLRLDTRVDAYARLSPSILREFLTYTVVGPAGDGEAMARRAAELEARTTSISRQKLALAARVASEVAAGVAQAGAGPETRFCIVVAGDVVYEMAHDVPRPERSTGTMVQGSDLDIVVLVDDQAPGELVEALDRAMFQKKYRYLTNPVIREEIDYVVKRFARLEEQSAFDELRSMIACKIFDEAVLLEGSERLFAAGKGLLRGSGVTDRLRDMEQSAVRAREAAERHLLATDEGDLDGPNRYLFYTDHESDEFE